jgi:EF hand domain-containing protein
MVSSVTSSAGLSTAMLSGSQCRGTRDPQALREKLFSKLDVNGDGGIDQSELSQFVDFASSSTGSTSATSDTSGADLFKSMDTNGDGTLSKTELADGTKKLFDELRTQLMSQVASTATSSDTQATGDAQSADASQSAPPPTGGHHHHGGGGMASKIASLLDQYRSTATNDTTDSTESPSTLSVAA